MDTVFIFTQLKLNYRRASRSEERTGWIEGQVRGRSSTGTLSLALSSKMLHFHIFLRWGVFFPSVSMPWQSPHPFLFFYFVRSVERLVRRTHSGLLCWGVFSDANRTCSGFYANLREIFKNKSRQLSKRGVIITDERSAAAD